MTDTRERIRRHVTANPGVHVGALKRSLDLASGQAQHHLRRLRRRDALVAEDLYGRTHYYPPTYDADERAAIALLRRETSRDVVVYLLDRGPTTPATVADDLGIARSTLAWHCDRLAERDLVAKRRDEAGRVTLAPARPEPTARLLTAVSPSLPERLTDRFTRLVDDLLAGRDE